MRTVNWGRTAAVAGFLAALTASGTPLRAQGNPSLARGRAAYENLDYGAAIRSIRAALNQSLQRSEIIEAYELLGFMYGALDSTAQAVEAFRNLITLDPDREPDPLTVSPAITSLYGAALGQVLVVRRVGVDSASFVAGMGGGAPLRFEVSQPADVRVRLIGNGIDVRVDSSLVSDRGGVIWTALAEDGAPLAAGSYQLLIEAFARPDQYSAAIPVEIRHSTVDTLPHLETLPGYAFEPEMIQPGRNWRPLGLAAVYTAIASGASLALENSGLGSPPRKEIGAVGAVVVLTGFIMSIRKPDMEPVEANIRYNRLLREQIAEQNRQRAQQNEAIRRQVRITVVSLDGGAP